MDPSETRVPPEIRGALYALAERICDIGQEVLDLEEEPATPSATANALPSAAVILAAAARTLLSSVREAAPREGELAGVNRRRQDRTLRWGAGVQVGIILERSHGPRSVGRSAPARVLSRSDPLPPYQ